MAATFDTEAHPRHRDGRFRPAPRAHASTTTTSDVAAGAAAEFDDDPGPEYKGEFGYGPDEDDDPHDYEQQWEDRCGDPEAALDRAEASYERYIDRW